MCLRAVKKSPQESKVHVPTWLNLPHPVPFQHPSSHLAQPASSCAISAPFCTPGSTCLIGLCCFSTSLYTWLNLPHSVLFEHPSAHLTQPSPFCAISAPFCLHHSTFLILCHFSTILPTSLNLPHSVLFQDPTG